MNLVIADMHGHTPHDAAHDAAQEAATVLLTSLMWELECLLHEYLCFNWDRIDDVLQSNEEALR